MTSFRSIAAACVAALIAAGCASSGSSAASADIRPPQIAHRGRMGPLQFSASQATGATITIDVEVAVDSTGVPIMSTFKVYGPMAIENRDAFYSYIQSSTFQPALRNGQPVEGTYRQQLKFSLQR